MGKISTEKQHLIILVGQWAYLQMVQLLLWVRHSMMVSGKQLDTFEYTNTILLQNDIWKSDRILMAKQWKTSLVRQWAYPLMVQFLLLVLHGTMETVKILVMSAFTNIILLPKIMLRSGKMLMAKELVDLVLQWAFLPMVKLSLRVPI